MVAGTLAANLEQILTFAPLLPAQTPAFHSRFSSAQSFPERIPAFQSRFSSARPRCRGMFVPMAAQPKTSHTHCSNGRDFDKRRTFSASRAKITPVFCPRGVRGAKRVRSAKMKPRMLTKKLPAADATGSMGYRPAGGLRVSLLVQRLSH